MDFSTLDEEVARGNLPGHPEIMGGDDDGRIRAVVEGRQGVEHFQRGDRIEG